MKEDKIIQVIKNLMGKIMEPVKELELVLKQLSEDQERPIKVKMYHTEEDGEQWFLEFDDPKMTTVDRILALSMGMTEDDGIEIYDSRGTLIYSSGLI